MYYTYILGRMDESDFQSDNGFDTSVMRSGIPKSMDKVVPLGEDSADLVYRNVKVMSNSSVRWAAGGDAGGDMLRSVGVDRKVEPMLLHSVSITKPVGARVTGKNQIALAESSQAAVARVGAFLVDESISSTHRLEASTHCWDCFGVSSSCQIVKFQIQSVPNAEGVTIEFKRDRGCCEALGQIFDRFRVSSGCPSAPSKQGRFRVQPPPLPDDGEDPGGCCGYIEQALVAMSQWIECSPVEALQSLGQLYGNKCQHLLRNENILADVCKSIQMHESVSSDMIALTLGLSCLRRILSIYSELSSPSPMTADLLGAIRGGLERAAAGKCLTARREAGLVVETINATVESHLKI